MIMLICGLFSSFDPGVMDSYLMSKWIFISVILLSISYQVFSLLSSKDLVSNNISEIILNSIEDAMVHPFKVFLQLLGLFIFFMFMNLWGMLPFSFPISSHLSINLSISMVLWSSGILYFLSMSIRLFMSHFVPLGSPEFLVPLLVLIEMISLLIRPVTLAIRLMANIMAGHLILTLVGELFYHLGLYGYPISMLLISPFLAFESSIAVVQAYVFMNLLLMYFKEAEDH